MKIEEERNERKRSFGGEGKRKMTTTGVYVSIKGGARDCDHDYIDQ